MENWVLGIFQEQLSKFIVGFSKDQVNANLLNGKGEITDLSLNCEVINDALNAVTPFIELESVHVSKLSFHVTSWTNLKHAPILIDIGDIHATLVEPLHFVNKGKLGKLIKQITKKQLEQLFASGKHKARGHYSLFDRILDNLAMEINSVSVTFQSRGKFKTKRVGQWTPPKIVATMRHVRYVSVNEYGQEASPEEVWKHNKRKAGQSLSKWTLLIFKKLSMECDVSLQPSDCSLTPPPLLKKGMVEVQIAFHKRYSDAACLSIQVDATLANVEIEVDDSAVSLLVHTMSGLQYCFAKDRGYEDPLLPIDHTPIEQGTEVSLPESDQILNASDSLVSEKTENEITAEAVDEESDDNEMPLDESKIEGIEELSSDEEEDTTTSTRPSNQAVFSAVVADSRDRPVILLPQNMIIHERVSFSLSVHQCYIRGKYHPKAQGYVQLAVKGLVAELIWPKMTGGKGAYVQASLSYVSLQERHGSIIRSILVGGMQDGDNGFGPVEIGLKTPVEVVGSNTFPLFEDRSIREDPMGLRYSFPAQALGFKLTMDCIEKASASDVQEDIMMQHEIGIDNFNFILDSKAWCRVLRFAMNEDGGGFDPRWHSGDWADILTTDMIINPSSELDLKDHLQPCKEFFLDDNYFISSDLCNVTARITSIEICIPAAIEKDVRSCDIVIFLADTMMMVSSALPRTFLSGKIGTRSQENEILFPNDKSDICYELEKTEDPSIRQIGSMTSKAISTFRVQVTMRGYSIQIVPVIPFCNAMEAKQLIAPTDVTMIMCFEGEPPKSSKSNLVKIVLFVSTLIQKLEINCDFDLLAGATNTLIHHSEVVVTTVESLQKSGIVPKLAQMDESKEADTNITAQEQPVSTTLKGRRVMVRRQITRSWETGGFRLTGGIEVANFSFSLWRQNVPVMSRLRPNSSLEIGSMTSYSSLPLIKLIEFQLKDLQVGADSSMARDTRRFILKCTLSEITVGVCDFSAECNNHLQQIEVTETRPTMTSPLETDFAVAPKEKKTTPGKFCMVELLAFNATLVPEDVSTSDDSKTSHRSIMLRLEEQMSSSRSISLSCEVTTGGAVSLKVKEIETFLLLIFEALLMPASRTNQRNSDSYKEQDPRVFPVGSVGHLLGSKFQAMVKLSKTSAEEVSTRTDPCEFTENREITQFVQDLLPKNTARVLLRLSVSNFHIYIPDAQIIQGDGVVDQDCFCLRLSSSTLSLAFFSSAQMLEEGAGMMQCLARNGEIWENIFTDQCQGCHLNLKSKQSVHAAPAEKAEGMLKGILVPTFGARCAFDPSNISVSIDDTCLSITDLQKLGIVYTSILSFVRQSIDAANNVYMVFSALEGNSRSLKKQLSVSDSIVSNTNSSNAFSYLNSAHDDFTVSIRSTRSSLAQIRSLLMDHDCQVQSTLRRKQKEVDRLRCLVFLKERDRLAALTLVASQATGWIRMGGTHQYGQRVSTTTTMWPYWAVLRRSLLILFTAPGAEAIEFISLLGAQLHPLEGGRTKQDVKRGFSLVEKSGTIHYFVAGSGSEYEMWTRELQYTLEYYSPPDRQFGESEENRRGIITSDHYQQKTVVVMNDNESSQPFAHNTDQGGFRVSSPRKSAMGVANEEGRSPSSGKGAKMRQRLAAVKSGTSQKLGSAVQNARQNVKAAAERQRHRHDRDERTDPEEPTASGRNSKDVDCSNSDCSELLSGSNEEVDHEQTKRSQQMRQKFSAVRAGTKMRLGSAVQAAKQNVRTVADKRRQRTLSEESNTSLHDAQPESLQLYQEDRCISTDTIAEEAKYVDTTAFDEGISTNTDIETKEQVYQRSSIALEVSNCDDLLGENATPRKQIGQPVSKIGSAVKSVQLNSSSMSTSHTGTDEGTGRFGLRRFKSQGSANNFGGEGPESVKMKSIRVGLGPLPSYENSSSENQASLMKVEGQWLVHVELCSEAVSKPTDNVESPEEVKTSVQSDNSDADSFGKAGSDPILQSKHKDSGCAAQDDEPSKSPSVSARQTISDQNTVMDPKFQQAFRIRVFEKLPAGVTRKPFNDVIRSFSDVLVFHTMVSEAFSRIPLIVMDGKGDIARNDIGEMNNNLASQLGLSPLDSIRMTGKLLGSLIVSSNDEHIDARSDYQCEILAEFLNSTIGCPLPCELHGVLVKFLGVQMLAKKTATSDTMEEEGVPEKWTAAPQVSEKYPSSHTETILALFAASESELTRAENRGLHAQKIASSYPTERPNDITAKLQMPQAVVDNSLPGPVSVAFHTAMHQALIKVMVERDEAHAQLVAGRVLHVHEIGQYQKKTERLVKQLEVLDDGGGQLFGGNENSLKQAMHKYDREIVQNSDAELLSLCQQLGREISEKTTASLENIRLKELREVEREYDLTEKEALKSELQKCKEMLAKEQRSSNEAQCEAATWKRSYEDLLEGGTNDEA